jgi:hypothetical protein
MFKKINIEVSKRIPVEWEDQEKKNPTKFRTETEEYGFNVYGISYWKGITTGEGKDFQRKTMLYLTGNPKAITLNIARESFEKQLEEQTKGDHDALMHLAGLVANRIETGSN